MMSKMYKSRTTKYTIIQRIRDEGGGGNDMQKVLRKKIISGVRLPVLK